MKNRCSKHHGARLLFLCLLFAHLDLPPQATEIFDRICLDAGTPLVPLGQGLSKGNNPPYHPRLRYTVAPPPKRPFDTVCCAGQGERNNERRREEKGKGGKAGKYSYIVHTNVVKENEWE